MSKLTREQRGLIQVQRLKRLVNREGNAVRVEFFTISDPIEDKTPDIDIDATSEDMSTQQQDKDDA